MEQVCVDPSRITALTLPACCCALALAADMDRKAAAIDGTDRQTDGRTPDRYYEPRSVSKHQDYKNCFKSNINDLMTTYIRDNVTVMLLTDTNYTCRRHGLTG